MIIQIKLIAIVSIIKIILQQTIVAILFQIIIAMLIIFNIKELKYSNGNLNPKIKYKLKLILDLNCKEVIKKKIVMIMIHNYNYLN